MGVRKGTDPSHLPPATGETLAGLKTLRASQQDQANLEHQDAKGSAPPAEQPTSLAGLQHP